MVWMILPACTLAWCSLPTLAMSATAGKVALLNVTTALSGACPTGAQIIDFVGFGTTASCNEGGTNAPAPSIITRREPQRSTLTPATARRCKALSDSLRGARRAQSESPHLSRRFQP